MMSDIYRKYFQKSITFLYPLLGFKKNKHPRPVQTYLSWKETGTAPHHRKLVCVYEKKNTEEWKNFEREHLITHKMLELCVPVDDNTIVYIFDFNHLASDFDFFLKGKYSELSTFVKKTLTDYYGTHTPEWVYIESYLFPGKYFKQYADILLIDEQFLKQVGQLCDRYDPEKEVCDIHISRIIEQPIQPIISI
jgi:hypothetical protein